MILGGKAICDYNSFIKECSLTHGVLVWRKLNGHFVKLLHSSGEKCPDGDSHLYPGKCDVRVLSPWSDNRPPKMGDYWVPNTKPSLNCGLEILNSDYDNFVLDLYQDYPEQASPSKPKNLLYIQSRNVKLDWTENYEPDFDRYKIYKMKGTGKYENYDISDTNYYVDQFEKTIADAEAKTYAYYKITAVDDEGNESTFSREVQAAVLDDQTTAVKNNEEIIQGFFLSQNYPNPFNPTTTIKYSIPTTVISNPQRGERSHNSNLEISPSGRNDNVNVSLKVYDILGRELATLVNQNQKPGDYEVVWDASTQPTGVYFYQLMADEYVEIKQMLLLK